MAVSAMSAVFPCDVAMLWNTVTDLNDVAWRSDLARVERRSETSFVEYTKNGQATCFTITLWEPMQCWEFNMENENMFGSWRGIFSQTEEGACLRFQEEITGKRWWMRLFIPAYLRRQQTRYLADLRQRLLDGACLSC